MVLDAGRRLLRGAEALGGELVAIVNSHAHADHFGGNALLLKRTATRVHAPAQEEATLRYLDLEPFCLFGAAPPVELTTRFLRAEASRVNHMADVFLAIDAHFGEETLAPLEGFRARLTVPSHGPPTASLGPQPTLEGYYLNLSTIRGRLTSFRAEGLAAFPLERGRLLWERR